MKTQAKIRQNAPSSDSVAALNNRNRTQNPASSIRPSTEFGKTLRSLLGKASVADDVSEEEFFAGAVYHLIKDNFGAEVAHDFKSTFKLNMADKPANEKVASAERATKESLKFFVNATILTKEQADAIKQVAFQAAQLDKNKNVLWDSLGETRAVSTFAKVQNVGQKRLEESGYTPQAHVMSGNARATSIDQRNVSKRSTTPTMRRVG